MGKAFPYRLILDSHKITPVRIRYEESQVPCSQSVALDQLASVYKTHSIYGGKPSIGRQSPRGHNDFRKD